MNEDQNISDDEEEIEGQDIKKMFHANPTDPTDPKPEWLIQVSIRGNKFARIDISYS